MEVTHQHRSRSSLWALKMWPQNLTKVKSQRGVSEGWHGYLGRMRHNWESPQKMSREKHCCHPEMLRYRSYLWNIFWCVLDSSMLLIAAGKRKFQYLENWGMQNWFQGLNHRCNVTTEIYILPNQGKCHNNSFISILLVRNKIAHSTSESSMGNQISDMLQKRSCGRVL